MTAGRGIVHSERSPEEERNGPLSISGVQTWLALPEQFEEIDPHFYHTNSPDLPLMEDREFNGRLIIGSLHGVSSPVIQHAETLYADIEVLPEGAFISRRPRKSVLSIRCAAMSALAVTCFQRTACWLSVRVMISWCRLALTARTLCYLVERHLVPSDMSGGISFRLPKSVLNRPKRNGALDALILCRAMKKNSYLCRNDGAFPVKVRSGFALDNATKQKAAA